MDNYTPSPNRLRELAAEADRSAKATKGGELPYMRLAKGCRTLLARLGVDLRRKDV